MRIKAYTIQEGVPMPKERGKWGFMKGMKKSKVGAYFFIPEADVTKNTRPTVYASAKNYGFKVRVNQVEGGLGVWKTGNLPKKQLAT